MPRLIAAPAAAEAWSSRRRVIVCGSIRPLSSPTSGDDIRRGRDFLVRAGAQVENSKWRQYGTTRSRSLPPPAAAGGIVCTARRHETGAFGRAVRLEAQALSLRLQTAPRDLRRAPD